MQAHEGRVVEGGFTMVESRTSDEFDDDYDFLDRTSEHGGDGFEDQRVFGNHDWDASSTRARRAAPNGDAATDVPQDEVMARAGRFEPHENAFSPSHLSRAVSMPTRTMLTAPVSTQLGLRAHARDVQRAMTAPTFTPPADPALD